MSTTRRLRRTAGVTASILALAAPAAIARPATEPAGWTVSDDPPATIVAPASTTEDGGFDWASAGQGAAAGAALLLVGAFGVAQVQRSRTRDIREATGNHGSPTAH